MDDDSARGRWQLVPEYQRGRLIGTGWVVLVGVAILAWGTIALSDAFGLDRPSLEPIGTFLVVLLGAGALFAIWRRITVGGSHVDLGVAAMRVRAGLTIDVLIPYSAIQGVVSPPLPPFHWEGPVGYHPASQAVRVGSGQACVQVDLAEARRWGGVRMPWRFSRLWLGVERPEEFARALLTRLSDRPQSPGEPP